MSFCICVKQAAVEIRLSLHRSPRCIVWTTYRAVPSQRGLSLPVFRDVIVAPDRDILVEVDVARLDVRYTGCGENARNKN